MGGGEVPDVRSRKVCALLACGLLVAMSVAAGELAGIENKVDYGGEQMGQRQTTMEVSGGTAVPQLQILSARAGTVATEGQIKRSRLEDYFISGEITDEVYRRIEGRSYQEGGETQWNDLRYLKVLHYNFDHEIQVGELIVNACLAEEVCDIFEELFLAEYEIQSLRLIDDFWTGDGVSSDEASIQANNSSAFCYRVIAGKERLSRHAYGCAIDINPLQNPFVTYVNDIPSGYPSYSEGFVERRAGERHVITEDDVCCRIFKAHGFSWGGDWTNPKDYQHFEKNN